MTIYLVCDRIAKEETVKIGRIDITDSDVMSQLVNQQPQVSLMSTDSVR